MPRLHPLPANLNAAVTEPTQRRTPARIPTSPRQRTAVPAPWCMIAAKSIELGVTLKLVSWAGEDIKTFSPFVHAGAFCFRSRRRAVCRQGQIDGRRLRKG